MSISLQWQRIGDDWWLVTESTVKVAKVSWDETRAECVDDKGRSLGRSFDGAKEAMEKLLGGETGKAVRKAKP